VNNSHTSGRVEQNKNQPCLVAVAVV